jgi:uncharacterized membrane protein YbhN (UPF0104 family)
MESAGLSGKRVIQTGFRTLLILVALAPLGYNIYKKWPELEASIRGVAWGPFGTALLFLLPVMAVVGVVPWVSLRYLGHPFSYPKATGIYFFTQIFKYLPGGFWAFPGRVAVYQFLGVGSAQSVISVFRETAAIFLGAAAVGLLGLLQGYSLSSHLRWAVGLGILVSAAVILLIQIPWVWEIFSRFKLLSSSPLAGYREADSKQRGIAWLPWTFLGSVIFWFLFGLPFRQMAIAVDPRIVSLSWLEAASIFALAWCAGFVVVFIPAGIGVRESALVLLLANIMPDGAALSLALLSRVAWILAEGFWILITMIWVSKGQDLSWEALRQMRG